MKKKEINVQEEFKKGLTTAGKKSKGFISEFKQFIAKGNVMDLAVGVIIGTAFSNIVKSLTDNILMPLIGAIIGGIDFSNLSVPIKIWKESIDLNYGLFIQSTVDFLLTAFCIFVMVKIINGIIDNNDIKTETRFAFYEAFNNLDENFYEIKRNNPEYIS